MGSNSKNQKKNVAQQIISCLEKEGVKYIFGIPGEENIHLVDATVGSSIRFILVRHEQGASFMADIYGRLTGKAGVCFATLGPGAINLLLGVADANTDSVPVVAITAQVGLNRIYKESHQYVDLVSMFKPVTKWADIVLTTESTPEMVRKAFSVAQAERPGATYLAIPQDIEEKEANAPLPYLPITPTSKPSPDSDAIAEAIKILKTAKNPVILVGHGVTRGHASKSVTELVKQLNIPVATTFMGKGGVSDKEANALGVVGFMKHDYENFAFDKADVIISIGYELQEFDPARINPNSDKKIIHINTFSEDTDKCYSFAVNIIANIEKSVQELLKEVKNKKISFKNHDAKIKKMLEKELSDYKNNTSFPMKPQRIINDVREALGDEDILLSDTGAVKMWAARLYPTYKPNTCLISNGLATMAFSLPGAIAAKLAHTDKKVLAIMGDASFMMNSQEIETAVREQIPLVVLIWEDKAYGLIKWKMDIELGHHDHVDFTNPDFVKYAESFGAIGYRIKSAEELLPTLNKALSSKGVHIITCPVDYSENVKLTDRLGALTISL